MQKSIYSILSFILICFLTGCGKTSFEEPKELLKWMSDEDNGLIKTAAVNGIKLTVKYLPSEYLTYRDWSSEGNQASYAELLEQYSNSRTFLLTIGPDEESGAEGDVMFRNVLNKQDYSKRVNDMNFNINQYIQLNVDGKEMKPRLHTLENTYSLTNFRNIYVVFSDDDQDNKLMNENQIDFQFQDPIFQTGINHFVFKKEDLDQIPELEFITKN